MRYTASDVFRKGFVSFHYLIVFLVMLLIVFAVVTPFFLVPLAYTAVWSHQKKRTQRFGLKSAFRNKFWYVLFAICACASFMLTLNIPTVVYGVRTEMNTVNDFFYGDETGLTHKERYLDDYEYEKKSVFQLGRFNVESTEREVSGRTVELEEYKERLPDSDDYLAIWALVVVCLPLSFLMLLCKIQADDRWFGWLNSRSESQNKAVCYTAGTLVIIAGSVSILAPIIPLAAAISEGIAGEISENARIAFFFSFVAGVTCVYGGKIARDSHKSSHFKGLIYLFVAIVILPLLFGAMASDFSMGGGGLILDLVVLICVIRGYYAARQTEGDFAPSFMPKIGQLYRKSLEMSKSNMDNSPSDVNQIERLVELREAGEITEEEFSSMKQRVVDESGTSGSSNK